VTAVLEVQPVTAAMEPDLAALFDDIRASGDDRYFHPHPFDAASAARIAHYSGRDLYFAATLPGEPRLAGYGMLRGWDAGYEVPSLGIIIAPWARGRGLSRPLMQFMHEAARARGCDRIRLKVYPDNAAALKLYRGLGYVFSAEEQGQLVGSVRL
jgi:ribosomal-protein-alanine N-acetyltransferase